MKRFSLLLLGALTLTLGVYAQKDLTISGGNTVSAMVCENSVLYVWGNNKLGGTTGALGVGSTAAYVDKPTEVEFFSKENGLYIRQVNCGSGAHFVAIDCNGKVWSWGNNSFGQCGTGTISQNESTVQATPNPVKIGTSQLQGTEYDCDGQLCNVEVVYAGNNNSFAILGEGQYQGCLVGWGANSKTIDKDGQGYDNAHGQLGCGNQNHQPYPVFVLDGKTKKPLQGVVQIYAGDNCAYALVDPDGDGIGTVYSWGHEHGEGQLGRGATGGAGSPGAKTDPYARPVCHADGSPLDNIKLLGCGDGEGYALDEDGYIWAWGNGAWNNAAGVLDASYSWYADGANYSTPLRVRKGLTTGASNDGTYLLAKYVAGGQGFGMAITADNKPVAWGGGGCGDGGAIGNGSVNGQSKDKAGAEYIQYAAGKTHSNVVLINRADTWGFYGLDNGDIYAWGCNEYGQLGIGGTTAQAYAKKINPPNNCNPRHPDPAVDLTPGDMTVCASAFNGQELNSGFVIGQDLASYYTIDWYKDGKKITAASGLVSAKGTKYKATETGKYMVVIKHVESGTGTGCVSYDSAYATVTIAEYPKTFEVPDEIIYCADKGEIPSIGVTTTNKRAVYSWYASKSATTPIATTIGNETKEMDFSTVQLNNGKGYIYVEETSNSSGTFLKKGSINFNAQEDYLNAGNLSNMQATGFYVYEPITLTNFSFNVNTWLYNAGSGVGTVTFTIYGANFNNGGYIPNSTSYGTITASDTVTTTSQNNIQTFTATGSVKLKPGQYFIVPTKYAWKGESSGFKMKRGSTSIATSTVDDATGKILQFQSIANGNNPNQNASGYIYDIGFTTGQGFCDRIEIPISEECPCSMPTSVTIKSSDDDGVLCPGGTSTLTPTAQKNAKEFAYVWYKGSVADANIVAGPSTTNQLTYDASEAGTYIVRVYDALMPNSKCSVTAEVELEEADNPTVTIGKGADYCDGDDVKDITLTFTGNAPFTYKYAENAGTAKSATADSKSDVITPSKTVAAGKASSSYEYTITELSDKYCTALASGYAGSATVTIGAVPTATITASAESVCEPNTITLTGAAEPTTATLAWGGSGSGSGATQTASGADVYDYTLTATNVVGTKSCVSEEATQKVEIYAKPTVTIDAPVKAICSGGELTVNATAKVGTKTATAGAYEWTNATGTGASVTVSEEATWPNQTTTDVSVVFTSEDGCVSEASNSITLTFDPKPDAPIVSTPVSYCTTADPSTVKVLDATISSGATATWYSADGTALSAAPKPSIASAGTTSYFVTQTKAGCESDKAQIDVIVNAELQPGFILSADAICENTSATITLGQADSYTSIEWSGDATAYFNGTKIYNPTFAGADVTTPTTYNFRVDVADKNGCTGKTTGSIVVNPVPTASLSTPDNEHCITETTPQVITATIEPSMTGTGTWSSNVTKTGETTATFTPSANAADSYTVTYSFVSSEGCATEKEANQTMIVDALPTPSFTLSNTSVCVSGNNSDAITVTKTTPGAAAGTTFQYAIDKGTIDASTGTFDPAGQNPGKYTVTLTYTDANGCINTTTNEFVVHALPTVEINAITKDEICYNSAAVDLATTVYSTDENGALKSETVAEGDGTGVWSGSITTKTFDPIKLALGENEMTYTYTDKYKCQNSDDYAITIKKPKAPTAGEDVNEMVNSLLKLEGDETLTVTSNEGDNAGLQWMPSAGLGSGSFIQEGGNTYTVPMTKGKADDSDLVGSYPYAVRQMISVGDAGCYSDSVIVTLNISKCNAMAPSVNFADRYVCETGMEISADFLQGTRVEGTNPPENYRIAWLTANPVGKKSADVVSEGWEISGTSVDKPGATAVNYKPAKETKDYYVAEYSVDEDCWSVGTRVSVHVVPNPDVTVSSVDDICLYGDATTPVTVSPVATGAAVGSLTKTEVGTLNGNLWSPGEYTGDNLSVTFTYEYTTEPYSDGNTCSSEASTTTVAHFMQAPDPQTYTWLIGDIANIPDGYVQGELSSTGKTMFWYEDQLLNNGLNKGTSLDLDKTALQAAANGQLTMVETYWITQKDDFGCVSEPSKVVLNLVDCPWEAPAVDAVEACLDKTLDDLVATEGETVNSSRSIGGVKNWYWYEAGSSTSIGSTSTLNVQSLIDRSNVTNQKYVKTYEVAYDAVEASSQKSCMSPKSTVTVTVYPLPVIELAEKETACYSTEEVLISVNASSANGTGSGAWTIDKGETTALKSSATSAIFYPQANGEKSDNYTITYTYTDEKTCVSSEEHKIEVIYLPKPATTGFFAMSTQTNPVEIGAEKTVGDGIAWFAYAASTDAEDKLNFSASTKANMYLTGDQPNQLADKSYYARQYKVGSNDNATTCYSESEPATVVIKICPVPSVEIANVDSCVYNGNPTLTAMPGEWLDKDGARTIEKTTYRFYKSEDGGKTYSTTAVDGTTDLSTGNGTYVPNIIPSNSQTYAGYYYFTVSEYNAEPYAGLTHPEGCESVPSKVVVNMKATVAPMVSAVSVSEVCDGDENPAFRVAKEDAQSLIYWYENDEPNPNSDGNVDTLNAYAKGEKYTPMNNEIGENLVYAVQYLGGCFSPQTTVSFTVKENPPAPEPVTNEICYEELSNENRVIKAVGAEGSSITWFRNENKTKILKANSDTYQPADTAVDVYYYYAMQTVNGCSGPVAAVAFTVKPLPTKPVIAEVPRKCTYDEPVMLTAEGTDVLWYAADRETVLNPGEPSNEYQTTDTAAGRQMYYATQTLNGCEGPMGSITWMIYKQPEKPNVIGANVCQGDTAIPTLSTDLLLDKWYADEDKANYLTSGYTYTPEVGANEYGPKLFYVQREQNGCLSPIAIDTLYIVQHPSVIIDEDRIMCIYDTIQPIKANEYVPSLNDRSSVTWRVKTGKVSKFVQEVEGDGHAIVPSDIITEEGGYDIYASYRYVYENIYCESDEATMHIDVKGRARTPIVFSTTICAGEKIEELRSLGSPNTVWQSIDYEGRKTEPEFGHGQSYKFQPGQDLDTGEYRYVIYDMNMYDEENLLGCKSLSDTVSMIVAPAAKTKLYGRDSVCLGLIGEAYYTQYEKDSKYFWNVTGDNLNYSKDANSTSVRYIDWLSVGIDTLTVYEQTWAGCEGFDTLLVKIAPAPVAGFSWSMPGASNILELVDSSFQDSLWTTNAEGERVGLPITYKMDWNFGHAGTPESQIDTTVEYEKRHWPIQEGNYLYGYNCPILTVTNDFGCKSTYSECIFVNISKSLYVPTAFSPTNPAHSVRTFAPKGFNLESCEISVYDKWGNLLWFSNEVEDGMFVGYWDGRYDGKMMKADVYIWKMEATFLDGQKWQGFDAGNGKKTKFGSVTLLR